MSRERERVNVWAELRGLLLLVGVVTLGVIDRELRPAVLTGLLSFGAGLFVAGRSGATAAAAAAESEANKGEGGEPPAGGAGGGDRPSQVVPADRTGKPRALGGGRRGRLAEAVPAFASLLVWLLPFIGPGLAARRLLSPLAGVLLLGLGLGIGFAGCGADAPPPVADAGRECSGEELGRCDCDGGVVGVLVCTRAGRRECACP